jgi:hypothetical protein
LEISQDCLPAKVYEGATPNQRTVRYFVDKFPLFVAPPFPSTPPVVTFSYVDSGLERPSNFASHLSVYQPLFRQLNSFRFLYIAAKESYFCGAEERFRSLVRRPLESDASNEILRYFQIRKKWDNHEYVIPVTADLEFLRDAREHFQEEKIESLYKSWRSGQLGEGELRAQISQQKPDRAIFFDTYLVNAHGSAFAGDACQGDGCMKDTDHLPRHGSVAKVTLGVVPAHSTGKGSCFARPGVDVAVCNAGCNGSQITKGGETLGTFESTVEATQDHNPSGPPGGRSQAQPGQVCRVPRCEPVVRR